jgi:hypothetical protein
MESPLRVIGRNLRRVFGARPRASSISPHLELTRLQEHLSDTCGGAVIGCGDCKEGGYLVPIVNYRPFGMEVAALVCVTCHAVQALDKPGRIEGEQGRILDGCEYHSVTVH